MARDSTNPRIPWTDAFLPPLYANVFEVIQVTDTHVTIRFGLDDGKDADENLRLMLPREVAGAIGGSLLSSFGGKP
ncbi:MAG: hypothetical protein EBR34_16485 [Sphingomonadaceae bacterium]|nr:hypothetical protein [Sphingomonadaceae bacterium]